MSAPTRAVVDELYRAFAARDAATLERLLARAEWRVPGGSRVGGTYRGPAEVMGYFAKLRELSGGTFRAEVLDVMASEGRAAVLARATGTREGRAAYDTSYVLVLEVRGGAILTATLFNEDQAAFDAFWG